MPSFARKLVAVMLASLLVSSASALPFGHGGGGGGKPNEFDPAAMSSPEGQAAVAKKYWKGEGIKKIRAAGYKKAAIVEFAVEYVVMERHDYDGSGNFGLLDVAQYASGAGKKHVELDEDLKERLPRKLYDEMRERLIQQGFEVKTLDEVVSAPAYAQLTGTDDVKTKKATHGDAYTSTTTEKKEIYPVDGLINIKMGAFAAMNNVETQAELASQLGVDVLLRAHFKVGVIMGGRPTVEAASWISVGAGPTSSTGPGGNARYSFAQWGQLNAKDGFVYNKDVTDSIDHKGAKGKIMDVNSDAFEGALLEMFPSFVGMAATLMDAEGD
jgi:hypothetical protein